MIVRLKQAKGHGYALVYCVASTLTKLWTKSERWLNSHKLKFYQYLIGKMFFYPLFEFAIVAKINHKNVCPVFVSKTIVLTPPDFETGWTGDFL